MPASQEVEVVLFSSETNEYYTPVEYIEAAKEVMGGIDLDPASCHYAQQWIQAKKYYTKEEGGLISPWFGKVFLNPPYGRVGRCSSQGYWGRKLLKEFKLGNITEGIMLTRTALGYNWFENLWDQFPAACFVRDRISFIRPNGSNSGVSKQGRVFFYIGSKITKIEKFCKVFRSFGRIILLEDQISQLSAKRKLL